MRAVTISLLTQHSGYERVFMALVNQLVAPEMQLDHNGLTA